MASSQCSSPQTRTAEGPRLSESSRADYLTYDRLSIDPLIVFPLGLGKGEKSATNSIQPERVGFQRRLACELLQSSRFAIGIESRALPWAGIGERLRRLSPNIIRSNVNSSPGTREDY